MKLEISARCKRDIKLAIKRGLAQEKLWHVVQMLMSNQELPAQYQVHILKGKWQGFMECHIEPDWLLIWREIDDTIILTRTGTHSDLFKK